MHYLSYGHWRAYREGRTRLGPHWGERDLCVQCSPASVDVLGPVGRAYREGPFPRFRDRLPGTPFEDRKAGVSPPWDVTRGE